MEAKVKVKAIKIKEKIIRSPDYFLGTNELPMESANKIYSRGMKRFMLAPRVSPEQLKTPSSDPSANQPPEGISLLPRVVTQCHEPSPFPFQDVCPT